VLRVLTSVTYRPALAFVQDTFDYLENAAVLQPGLVRPSGYPAFLRILSVAGSIAVVPVVQHVLGLSTGVLLYALLRRLGVGAWMATLGAAPVLLDSYQIYLEQFLLAEAVFEFLVVVAVVLLLWHECPSPMACAGVGVLLAGAALTRAVGVVLVAAAVLYLVIGRAGTRRVASATIAAAVVLGAYATWFSVAHGRFALGAYEGYFLAGRVAPFADCRGLEMPPLERPLCDPRPVPERPNSDWYVWNAASPLRRPVVAPGTDRNAVAGRFAARIVRHQPLDYLGTIAGDVWRYFGPGRETGPDDVPVGAWQFRTSFVADQWRPLQPPADRHVSNWASPGASVASGVTIAAHGYGLSRVEPTLYRPTARWLRGYQRFGYTQGPILGAGLLVGLCAGLGRLPPPQRRLRRSAAFLAGSGLLVVVAPAATSVFEFRYLIPALTLLPAAGAAGTALLHQRLQARRRPSRAAPIAAPRA